MEVEQILQFNVTELNFGPVRNVAMSQSDDHICGYLTYLCIYVCINFNSVAVGVT